MTTLLSKLSGVAKRSAGTRHFAFSLAGNVLARLAGLAMATAIAWAFGATRSTDAFYLALATTLYVFEIARIAFEGALIPTLTSYLERGRAAVERFLAACLKYWVIASATVSVAAAAVGLALGWRATGTGGEALRYGAGMMALLIPLGIAGIGNSLLFAEKRFFIPSIGNAFRPLMAVVGIMVCPRGWQLWGAYWGLLLGSLMQAAFSLTIVLRAGYRLRLSGALEELYGPMKLAAPIVLGAVLININPVVDRFIAALMLVESSVTIYENSFKVYGALTSLFYGSLGVVVISHWSALYVRRNTVGLSLSLRKIGGLSIALLPLLTALMIVFSRPLMALAFGRGAYTAEDVAITAQAFAVFAIGLWPFFAAGMGSRFLYATGYTRVALVAGSLALVVNIAGDVALAPRFGVTGIALATTLTYVAVAVYVLFALRARLRQLGGLANSTHNQK